MKKGTIVAVILSAMIMMGLLSTSSFAGTYVVKSGKIGDFSYTIYGEADSEKENIEDYDSIRVTLRGERMDHSNEGTLIIPGKVDGFPVDELQMTVGSFPYVKDVQIEEGVKIISADFSGVPEMESISIPDTVVEIKNNLSVEQKFLLQNTRFYREEKNWENGLLYVGNYLVAAKEDITEAQVKDNIIGIADGVFLNCKDLKHITLPDTITRIPRSFAENCASLEEIKLPDSLTYIGNSAFYNCSSLKQITIPSHVTDIDSSCLASCDNLASIDVNIDNDNYCSIDGVLYTKDRSKLVCCPGGKKGTCRVFANTTSVSIDGDNLNAISVDENNTVFKSIDGVLYDKEVTTMKVVPGMKAKVVVPDSVTKLESAFTGCSKLEEVVVGENNATFSAEDNIIYNKDKTVIVVYLKNDETVRIGNSVETIGRLAFSGNKTMKTVIIPGNVKTIEWYAFSNASDLETVVMCEGVDTIGNHAFSGCPKLKCAVIPDSVKAIANGAFSNDPSIEKIALPSHLELIPMDAFYLDKGLKTVGMPASVNEVYQYAFGECYAIKDVFYESDEQQRQKIDTSSSTASQRFNPCLWAANWHYNHVHKWDAGIVVDEATSEHEGVRIITCEECGKAKTEIIPQLEYILGDVNGTGVIDAKQLTTLARHLAKIDVITSEVRLQAGDVNKDNEVTAGDLTKLAKFVAKIIPEL